MEALNLITCQKSKRTQIKKYIQHWFSISSWTLTSVSKKKLKVKFGDLGDDSTDRLGQSIYLERCCPSNFSMIYPCYLFSTTFLETSYMVSLNFLLI